MERLQKYLASCGVASRRKAEEIIASGRVKVNDVVVTEMGYKVTNNDIIKVDDIEITREEKIYLVMNKPRYVVTTTNDEHNRKEVISILPSVYKEYRLYPVGRLDYDTKGVLLLTNDGDFMNMLVGPRSEIEKEYLVRLDGIISKEDLRKLQQGVTFDNYTTRPAKAYLEEIDKKNNSCLIKVIITEGKNHQVKNMCSAIGYSVKRLTRTRFGCITVEGIAEGEVRELTPHEIKQLVALANANK